MWVFPLRWVAFHPVSWRIMLWGGENRSEHRAYWQLTKAPNGLTLVYFDLSLSNFTNKSQGPEEVKVRTREQGKHHNWPNHPADSIHSKKSWGNLMSWLRIWGLIWSRHQHCIRLPPIWLQLARTVSVFSQLWFDFKCYHCKNKGKNLLDTRLNQVCV